MSSFTGVRAWTVAAKPRAAVMMNLDTIQGRITDEIKKAQEASDQFGKTSKQARVAWDIVEELEAEASHLKANQTTTDPLEEFCKDSPDADECRVYED